MWRVLIVEDDPGARDFFSACIRRSDDLALVAAVGSVAQAFEQMTLASQPIDVVLVDLGLPDGSGLEVIRQARRQHPACEPLVISMFGDEDNVMASIEAGALGYIHKDAAPEDIAQTIIEMKRGASPISPMIARRVLAKYAMLRADSLSDSLAGPHSGVPAEKTDADTGGVLLSPREREILGLIARGFSYAEIARVCEISIHTVQTHIKSLYGKLSVNSRSEAVFEATQMGLLRR